MAPLCCKFRVKEKSLVQKLTARIGAVQKNFSGGYPWLIYGGYSIYHRAGISPNHRQTCNDFFCWTPFELPLSIRRRLTHFVKNLPVHPRRDEISMTSREALAGKKSKAGDNRESKGRMFMSDLAMAFAVLVLVEWD